MLGLGWRYRWGCLGLLVMQSLLLGTALGALRLVGLGIDLIHWHAKAEAKPPDFFLLKYIADWRPLAQVALIAVFVLAMELMRGALNYCYALSAGYLIHT